ncbi:MAG: glycosyltransferase [bacterium]
MRILSISHSVPVPPSDGGKIVVLNTARALAGLGHDLGLAAISVPGQDIPKTIGEGMPIWAFPARTAITVGGMVRTLLARKPYVLSKYQVLGFSGFLRRVAHDFRPDIIHVEFLAMAEFGCTLGREFGLPVVLRSHNVDSVLMARFRDAQRNLAARWFAGHEFRRLIRYERLTLPQCTSRVAITQSDARALEEIAGVRVSAIPSGIDVPEYQPMAVPVVPGSVAYVASLDWMPNVDSATWFIAEVLPRIRAVVPNMVFHLVGRNPPQTLLQHDGRDSIVVTGAVDDVRPWIARTEVLVVPTRIGSGMRIKILEAMAMGKPVVTTRVGCEGIEGLVDGENVLIADTAGEFAAAASRLLGDREMRHRIGAAGRELVVARYQWQDVARQFEEVYRDALATRS